MHLYWSFSSDIIAVKGLRKVHSLLKLGRRKPEHPEKVKFVEKTMYKDHDKNKSAVLSCPRHLASVIYTIRLISWNNTLSIHRTWHAFVTNLLSINGIPLECPMTTGLFRKDGYDFTTCNNVWHILRNTDVIISISKLIVHCFISKLI